MKVHKVTLLVVDFDDLGAESVADVLRETRYPNHCIAPNVIQVETAEVEWSDDHPLNRRDTMRAEAERLFSKGGHDGPGFKYGPSGTGQLGLCDVACRKCALEAELAAATLREQAPIAASPRPMIITITCDRAGCASTITFPDQGAVQHDIDTALNCLGWTVTVGTMRRYHACARCAG